MVDQTVRECPQSHDSHWLSIRQRNRHRRCQANTHRDEGRHSHINKDKVATFEFSKQVDLRALLFHNVLDPLLDVLQYGAHWGFPLVFMLQHAVHELAKQSKFFVPWTSPD